MYLLRIKAVLSSVRGTCEWRWYGASICYIWAGAGIGIAKARYGFGILGSYVSCSFKIYF
ncbi:hypothetical protein F2Y53_19400 [Bacteroides cellulosilyticus]|nr:hypothetical protein F2Y53_19400 [Bacteroides cellulosilyticus]